MNGWARTFFAVTAVGLRALSWVPFFAADRLNALANWCEGKAAGAGWPRP